MSGSKDRLSREEKRERGSRIHFLDFSALTLSYCDRVCLRVVAAEKGPFYL